MNMIDMIINGCQVAALILMMIGVAYVALSEDFFK